MAPATSQELDLHQRLVNGDEIASAELFERYMDEVAEYLKGRRPGIALHNEDLVNEAVADAFFDYIARPERYNPQGKCLTGYLGMAAEMDLLNRWRKVPLPERNGQSTSYEDLAASEFTVKDEGLCYLNDFALDSSPAGMMCEAWQVVLSQIPEINCRETVEFLDNFVELGSKSGNKYVEGHARSQDTKVALVQIFWEKVRILIPDERERWVMVLMMSGIRETAAYAEALAIRDLTPDEQAEEVKRVKDKLKKRLQRADWRNLVAEARDVS